MDAAQALRVVGFLEYGEALRRFDALVAKANAAELAAFDQIVQERDEFAIFVNLTRSLPPVESTLNANPVGVDDNFERRGLAWIMALARVELAATVATYTNSQRPFEQLLQSRFGLEEYTQLIEDGMRVHFRSLAADPSLPRVLEQFRLNQQSLAYLRRLVLAQAFVDAVYRFRLTSYAPPQVAELQIWKSRLNTIQRRLFSHLEVFALKKQIQNDRLRMLTECQTACNRLLDRMSGSGAGKRTGGDSKNDR